MLLRELMKHFFLQEYMLLTYFRHIQFAKEDEDFLIILRYYFLIQSRYLLHMVCIFLNSAIL